MRVFVSEYICGGACPDLDAAGSLAKEGGAMLCAIVADLARVPQVTVATTWDARLGRPPFDNCDVELVTSSADLAPLFYRLATDCDAVFLIAPETGGILTQQARDVEAWGACLLGSSSRAIEICTDKLRLADMLQAAGVPTIETRAFDAANSSVDGGREWRFPAVVKPRDGAGSQSTFRIQSAKDFAERQNVFTHEALLRNAIWQPYVAGHAVSIAVVLAENGTPRDVFPVAEQRLSSDGRFAYLGGQIPASCAHHAAIRETALRACRVVPGLRGYVGIDLIVPAAQAEGTVPPGEPLVVEINPRLTTSYLGYRALATSNLAERLVMGGRPSDPLKWRNGPVTFDAAGILV